MRNYLILRDKVQAFRADPEVAAALAAAGVAGARRSRPWPRASRSTTSRDARSYDLEALGTRSVAQEALDQLAMEHLLGVR